MCGFHEFNTRGIAVKRMLFVVLFVFVICLSGSGLSQGIDRASLGLGAEYRSKTLDLKVANLNPALAGLDENTEAMGIEQDYDLHLRMLSHVELEFLFGKIDYDLALDSELEGYSHGFTMDSGDAFGFGGKLLFPFSDRFLMGVHFEHFTADLEEIELSTAQPTLSFTLEDGFVIPIDTVIPEKLKYSETVVTPVVSMVFGKFVPYAGARYTRVAADIDLTYMIFGEELEREIKYEVDEGWSLVVGAAMWLGENLSISAEMETLEHESYRIGVKYSF
jgi:hypothetical protein